MDASDVIGAVAPVRKSWRGFNPGQWQSEIDVRGFIVANATPYCGGPDSLAPL
jgi:pyruvate-formate lyase